MQDLARAGLGTGRAVRCAAFLRGSYARGWLVQRWHGQGFARDLQGQRLARTGPQGARLLCEGGLHWAGLFIAGTGGDLPGQGLARAGPQGARLLCEGGMWGGVLCKAGTGSAWHGKRLAQAEPQGARLSCKGGIHLAVLCKAGKGGDLHGQSVAPAPLSTGRAALCAAFVRGRSRWGWPVQSWHGCGWQRQ